MSAVCCGPAFDFYAFANLNLKLAMLIWPPVALVLLPRCWRLRRRARASAMAGRPGSRATSTCAPQGRGLDATCAEGSGWPASASGLRRSHEGADMMTAYIAGDAVTVDIATPPSSVPRSQTAQTRRFHREGQDNDWTIERGPTAPRPSTKRALGTRTTASSARPPRRIVWAYGDTPWRTTAPSVAPPRSCSAALPAFPTGDGSYTRTVTNYLIRSVTTRRT